MGNYPKNTTSLSTLKRKYLKLGVKLCEAFEAGESIAADELGSATLEYEGFPHKTDGIADETLEQFYSWKKNLISKGR